jgi:hypothetical protein
MLWPRQPQPGHDQNKGIAQSKGGEEFMTVRLAEMANILILSAFLAFVGCASAPLSPASSPIPTVSATDDAALKAWQAETFGPLATLAGRTLRGDGKDASGAGMVDVQAWNWALDGHVLRNVHVLEDGSYGGETLIYRDAASDGLAYVYVTSAGFRTEGTMAVADDGTWLAEETVLGHPRVTAVRSMGVVRRDGTIETRSEFVTADGREPGHSLRYSPWDGPVPVLLPPGQQNGK